MEIKTTLLCMPVQHSDHQANRFNDFQDLSWDNSVASVMRKALEVGRKEHRGG